MSKLERWLTLIANLSVVAGIIFLAAELRQNTQAIQAQTRDSITEKQMTYNGWMASSPDLAAVSAKVGAVGWEGLSVAEQAQYQSYVGGVLREWENSFYQFERGLFTPEEFQARSQYWRIQLAGSNGGAYVAIWQRVRASMGPSFRAEIDGIVAEVQQAQ